MAVKFINKSKLTAATLQSIALNQIKCKSPKLPKPVQRAIKELKQLDNIDVTKQYRGTGVVIMNKSDYVNLLSQVSINDTSKFTPISLLRPKMRGGPGKHYHPLLQNSNLQDGRFCQSRLLIVFASQAHVLPIFMESQRHTKRNSQ